MNVTTAATAATADSGGGGGQVAGGGDQDEQHVVFPTGSRVECETALHEIITGEVLCYDESTRLLVLRDTSDTKPLMRFVNLALVTNVTSVAERTADFVPHNATNRNHRANAAQERLKAAEAKKRNSLLVADVPRAAQAAFLAIRKTVDLIRWQGDSIVVFDRVIIGPPYNADCIQPLNADIKNNKEAEEHVRKILSKHMQSESTSSSGGRPSRGGSVDGLPSVKSTDAPPTPQ